MALKQWLIGMAGALASTTMVGPAQSAPLGGAVSHFNSAGAVATQVAAYQLCTAEGGVRRCRWVNLYGPRAYGYQAPTSAYLRRPCNSPDGVSLSTSQRIDAHQSQRCSLWHVSMVAKQEPTVWRSKLAHPREVVAAQQLAKSVPGPSSLARKMWRHGPHLQLRKPHPMFAACMSQQRAHRDASSRVHDRSRSG